MTKRQRFQRFLAKILRKAGLPAGLLIALGAGFLIHAALTPDSGNGAAAPNAEADNRKTVYTCAMDPQIRRYEPGKCPLCGMELKAVEEQESSFSLREFNTSDAAKALMGIRTAPAERNFVTAEVRMVGKVDYDETRVQDITAWMPGRLDRLFIDYTGVKVEKGDHLASIYSPELISAQEELLQARRAVRELERSDVGIVRESTEATLKAAREKLRLLGLKQEQIERIESTGKVSDHLTIYSPSNGVVIHKHAQEGAYVKTGSPIYMVADLSQVWVRLDAYESDLQWLHYGQDVQFTTVSHPGQTFHGKITFIDPVLTEQTRTVKVRLEAPNPDGKLKPGMFVKAVARSRLGAGGRVLAPELAGKWICRHHPSVVKDAPGRCDRCGMALSPAESLGYATAQASEADKPLVIPASAPLVTGTRAVVYVVVPGTEKPTFEGREIVLGPRAGDHYVVRHGLTEGQRVVTRGNFKIDSALQIKAKPSMMDRSAGVVPKGKRKEDVKLRGSARKQLRSVLEAAAAVQQAVRSGKLAEGREAFARLGSEVESVNEGLLAGPARLIWRELSMRLSNDAAEGSAADTLEAMRPVAELLRQDAAAVRDSLPLKEEPAETRPAKTPAAFRRQLTGLYEGYYAVRAALAEDDLASARRAASKARDALHVDASPLSPAGREAWQQRAAALAAALKQIAEAGGMQPARDAFAQASERMIALTRAVGAPPAVGAYVMQCPMARDGKGALWLQDGAELRNPYQGRKMPTCGRLVEVLSEKTGQDEPDE